MLDGYGKIEEYVLRAKKLNYKYLGITDHGNIDGLIHFQKVCSDNDIIPIMGVEAYLIEDYSKRKEKSGHICLWIKKQRGFKNICSMLSIANLDNYYRKPLITFDNLREHYKGLCIGTACLGSFLNLSKGEAFFRELKALIGDDLYLELMLNNLDSQKEYNKKIFKLSEETNTKIILTHDCHYANSKDAKYQEMMLAIQRKKKWNDPNRWKFEVDNLYLLSKKEIKDLCKEHNVSLEYAKNTFEVAEKCKNFRIKKREISLPKIAGIENESKYLSDLCYQKSKEINQWNLSYTERLDFELALITKKKFERYVLMVYELVQWCKDNNIMVGPGRGSVGGSLVAYLLGITKIDPIEHRLLFERFIAEDRIDYPDIDLDFDREKVHLVTKHLRDIYGVENVATVSNFNTFKARGSVQDVARVFGASQEEVNAFTKTIYKDDSLSEEEILEAALKTDEGKLFHMRNPKVLKYAKAITGRIRNYSQHAGAVIISPKPIDTSGRCNLIRGKDLRINWNKNDAEYVGYIKLDVLRLRLLSILSETLDQIKFNKGVDIDLIKSINYNDKKVFSEIDRNNNEGVFQLGTYTTSELIQDLEVNSFDTLVHLVALVRPGPKESGMTEQYIRRQRFRDWEKKHKVYEKLTEDTFGLLLFQEQIMSVISEVAGLPYSTADKIRKIISKKRDLEKFAPYEKMFKEGCKKTKIFSDEEANQFWDDLLRWSRYGFNKSHATGYAILAYQCAYLKYYFPTEFISASLTHSPKEKKKNLVSEAYRLGIKIRPPKVGLSKAIKWQAYDSKNLFAPFSEIIGLGEKKAIIAAEPPHLQKKAGVLKFFTMDKVESKHSGEIGELLDLIKAYDKTDFDLSSEAEALFNFELRDY